MDEEQQGSPIDDMDQKQMELYARDLEQLYWSEKQARSALAEEKLVLEYKLHELNALNRLFQANLQEETRLRESYNRLFSRLNELASQGSRKTLLQDLKKLLSESEAV